MLRPALTPSKDGYDVNGAFCTSGLVSPDLNPIDEAFSKVKGVFAQSRGLQPRGLGGGTGCSDLGGNSLARPRFLRTLWARDAGSTAMMNAVYVA
jgi:hypothetical protein